MSFNVLKSNACSPSNRSPKKNPRRRNLRLEQLEDRALLSVSAAEYAEICAANPELNLPESFEDLNVIEIQPADLTVASLKEALKNAGTTKADDLVVLRTTDVHNKITYASSSDEIEIKINPSYYGTLNVVAYGTKPLTIDARQQSRVLNIQGGTTGLANLTITGGKTDYDGGGIYLNDAVLTATNVTISGNSTSDSGGGIYVEGGGKFRAMRTSIVGNSSSDSGGGVYIERYGSLTAVSAVISENSASRGGGVYVDSNGTLQTTNTTISGNSANCGGGVYGSFTATNTIVAMNYGSTSPNSKLLTGSSNNLINYYPSFVCDPVFDNDGKLTNADSLDLRLRSDSVAVDAGAWVATKTPQEDLDGKQRVYTPYL